MKILLKENMYTILVVVASMVALGSCSTGNTKNKEHKKLRVPEIAFDPLTYLVYRANRQIKIDGKIDERIWKKVPWTSDFVKMKGDSEHKPKYRTRVKLLWNSQYLYVGAELQEENLWATMTKHDSPVYLDNALELFFDPDGDTHNYLEFEINALGTMWDLFLTKPYRDQGQAISSWNMINYKSAVKLDGTINNPNSKDKKWTVEFALPMSDLLEVDSKRNAIKNGDQWRANFSRAERRLKVSGGKYELQEDSNTHRPDGPDFSVWSPQGVSTIHYPEMWGILQFTEKIVGQGREKFTPNPDERIKWALRQVYYQLKEFYMNHGCYTENKSKLHLNDICINDIAFNPKIEVTKNLFEVIYTGFNEQTTWHIIQDGKVWKD